MESNFNENSGIKVFKTTLLGLLEHGVLLQKCSGKALQSKNTLKLPSVKRSKLNYGKSQCRISTKQSPSIRMKRRKCSEQLAKAKEKQNSCRRQIGCNRPKGCILICYHLNFEIGHYLQTGKHSCIREKQREGGRKEKGLNK